ncbi:hypothetical protein SAMN05443579_11391 [Variovorax sp. PDC80]|uniref:hypothetical protein n=1 Tax=Variovorax sp. PDC80 TaxID=1882827 RepID=UPI0008E75F1E|nr:hypothetical protein [Variovorax sp. PDC80]SFP63636.1 hypothetical protein SAMN05443579_11391 [Variovorax sp. PDC80]
MKTNQLVAAVALSALAVSSAFAQTAPAGGTNATNNAQGSFTTEEKIAAGAGAALFVAAVSGNGGNSGGGFGLIPGTGTTGTTGTTR